MSHFESISIQLRDVSRVYADPVELIWIHTAAQLGMRIVRSDQVNASWDGQGALTIGTPETLDADDSLAQMILHEICHALCEGPESLSQPDWGLASFDPSGKVHEHACLRLQAALADRYGMRSFFAATTVFRRYYDRIPADPLDGTDDPAIAIARIAWARACSGPWAESLDTALRLTAQIAVVVQKCSTPHSLWHQQPAPSSNKNVAACSRDL